MRPWEIIKELESRQSKIEERSNIRRESDADNIEFFNGVVALDGFRTFEYRKSVAKTDGEGLTQSEFDDVLRELEARTSQVTR